MRERLNTLRAINWTEVCLGSQRDEIIAARSKALARDVPMLYFVLTLNSVMISVVYVGYAPSALTILTPSLLCIACLVRAAVWNFRRFKSAQSIERMRRSMRNTVILGIVISVLFISWALSLFSYGDRIMRLHLVCYVIVTGLGCVLCLMHLPVGALVMLFIVILPLSVVLLASNDSIFVSISLNSLFVCVAVVAVVLSYGRNFEAMIASQTDAKLHSAEVLRLHAQTSADEAKRRNERNADLNRIAAEFTQSISVATKTLGEVAAHNGKQSRAVAAFSEGNLESLERVTDAAFAGDKALHSIAGATASLIEAIEGNKELALLANAISTKVETRTSSAERTMATLDDTIGRIDKISIMIKTIAGQIDMIALNATIEAVRAGGLGRGFTVIASEIKLLAAETTRATEDIGRHISDVEMASRAACASATEMKEAFLELRHISHQMAGALDTQSMFTANIQSIVDEAVSGSTITRNNLDGMKTSAIRTHKSAFEMLDRCDILGTETDSLDQEVNKFVEFIKAA